MEDAAPLLVVSVASACTAGLPFLLLLHINKCCFSFRRHQFANLAAEV